MCSNKVIFILQNEIWYWDENDPYYQLRNLIEKPMFKFEYFECSKDELKEVFKTGKWYQVMDDYIKLLKLPNGVLVRPNLKKYLDKGADVIRLRLVFGTVTHFEESTFDMYYYDVFEVEKQDSIKLGYYGYRKSVTS